ncbi:MAG: hypothetical protein ABRQ38_09105 [Candidatus Eremiobacterota bacterium]
MTCKKKKKKDNGRYTDTLVTETKLSEEGELKLYTAEYKINILKEAESLRHPGELGELLRREGLFSSHLATWYWQREKGELGNKEKQEESIKDTVAKKIDALEKEFYRETEKIKGCLEKRIEKLERKNKEFKIELEKANFIIETQKKIIAKLRASEKYR